LISVDKLGETWAEFVIVNGFATMTDDEMNLIVTDMHPRITGVGSTIRTLVPYIHSIEPLTMVSARTIPGIQSLGIWGAIKACLKRPKDRPFRIWHARRNKEMLLGLIIKHLLRGRIRLVMTSCALRRHSWFPETVIGINGCCHRDQRGGCRLC
jgi:mannosyltransferase